MLVTCDRLEKYKKEFSEMLLEEDGAIGRTAQQNRRRSRQVVILFFRVSRCCAAGPWLSELSCAHVQHLRNFGVCMCVRARARAICVPVRSCDTPSGESH